MVSKGSIAKSLALQETSASPFLLFSVVITELLILVLVFESPSIAVMGVLGLLLLYSVSCSVNFRFYGSVAIVLTIGFAAVLVTYFGYDAKYGSPYYLGGSDDASYDFYAKAILDWDISGPDDFSHTALAYHVGRGFIWMLSFVVQISEFFGGYHTMVFRIMNIEFLSILGILVYSYLVKKTGVSSRYGLYAYLAVGLFPNAIYISSHVFRDTLFALCLFAVFYIVNVTLPRGSNAKKVPFLLLAIALTYIASLCRSQGILIVGIIVVVSVMANPQSKVTPKSLLVLSLALIGVVSFLALSGTLQYMLDYSSSYTNQIAEDNLRSSSEITLSIFQMPLFPIGWLLRFLYALVFPFPSALLKGFTSFGDIDAAWAFIIAIGTLAQVVGLFYLIRSTRTLDAATLSFVILLATVALMTFTFRHFILLYPFMALLIFRNLYYGKHELEE